MLTGPKFVEHDFTSRVKHQQLEMARRALVEKPYRANGKTKSRNSYVPSLRLFTKSSISMQSLQRLFTGSLGEVWKFMRCPIF
jgi:hypothetical protein